jgi:hypothetical protein
MAITMRSQSRLIDLSSKFRFAQSFGLDLPAGKDGFLATHSLLAFLWIK